MNVEVWSPLDPSELPDGTQGIDLTFVELDCTVSFAFEGASLATETYRFDTGSIDGCENLEPDHVDLSGSDNAISAILFADEGELAISAERV